MTREQLEDTNGGRPGMNEDDFLIRVRFTADVDRDRLDEWLAASFKDEYVEVVDRETGDLIKTSGEDPPPFLCPACGEYAHGILNTGGPPKYLHSNNELCEVDDGE